MPARNSSMEISSPDPDAQQQSTNSRRKSGRVTKKPSLYATSSPVGSVKRKRAEPDEDQEIADGNEESEEDEGSDEEEEPDEEEVKEKRRKQRSAAKRAPKPPAKKKPKTNGDTVSLAIRTATAARPKTKPQTKAKRVRKARAQDDASAEGAGGLYADVFGGDKTLDAAADAWLKKFTDENESQAVADLVNLILKCAGCEAFVSEHDIEDPDNATGRLQDIQEEFQANEIVEYPLISRSKGTSAFKKGMESFFSEFVEALHRSELLYTRGEIFDHVITWVAALSSASSRPFRHTATVVAMAIITALCELAKSELDEAAKTIRQTETEKKKGRVNKERVKTLEEKARQAQQNQETLDGLIKEWFDATFIHRYRDIDHRIRVDCVQALGGWILSYPDHFFDGEHLRYIGWLLSDTAAPMRLEVVKQLHRLFHDQDNLGGLKTFTERFRPRMVEMATSDSEAGVRASVIELLDVLREAGYLEPNDIDAVGKLIFDAEPRVRKAVVTFFAQNIVDICESKIDDIGGNEAIEEGLSASEEDDFDHPRIEWLKLKALAEVLNSYDAEDDAAVDVDDHSHRLGYLVVGPGIETRFSLAAQALYDSVEEVRKWEVLSGYLLYDHSATLQNGASEDVEAKLRHESRLEEREELILLEVLNASVKLDFAQADESHKDKKSKLSKAQKLELRDRLEDSTRSLAKIIPRLLKKYGATPDAASAVLRLEPILNLEVFQDLRQEANDFAAHLDDINKQLLTHGSANVAVEASAALLHAKTNEELGEITEAKVQTLWEDTMDALHSLAKGKDLSVRGNLSADVLTALTSIVLRIENLSRISNCVEFLDTAPSSTSGNKRSKAAAISQSPDAFAVLLDILNRGVPADDVEEDLEPQEDAIVSYTASIFVFYFAWQVKAWTAQLSIGRNLSGANVEYLTEKRDALITTLQQIMRARHGADPLRIHIASTMLDVLTVITTLRTAKGKASSDGPDPHLDFITAAPGKVQEVLQNILIAAEKAVAKRMGRKLEVADDDEPVDPDDEPESSSDEQDEDDGQQEARKTASLVAERQLCEFAGKLVLGLVGGIIDEDRNGKGPIRALLERNRSKLGKNYSEVIAHLDEKKSKKGANARAKTPTANALKTKSKSKEMVVESEDEEEEQADEQEVEQETIEKEQQEAEAEAREREGEDEEMVDGDDDVESVIGD